MMEGTKKAVRLLSGGMDSTTPAYLAKGKGYEIYALHINCWQRTEKKEPACAWKIASPVGARESGETAPDYPAESGARGLTDRNEEQAWGTCGSFHYRRSAFAEAGMTDLILYEV